MHALLNFLQITRDYRREIILKKRWSIFCLETDDTICSVSKNQPPFLKNLKQVKKKKKKKNIPIYFNTNYLTEMKLVPIIMDY